LCDRILYIYIFEYTFNIYIYIYKFNLNVLIICSETIQKQLWYQGLQLIATAYFSSVYSYIRIDYIVLLHEKKKLVVNIDLYWKLFYNLLVLLLVMRFYKINTNL